jgi:large subunit ribosomal protein L17
MRHGKKVKKLSKERSHRVAMLRNLATSVILYEKIKTTQAKAKEAVKLVDKLIDYSKKDDKKSAIRLIQKIVFDNNASKKLIEQLKDRYKDKKSGYTRITALSHRPGDNAKIVLIELIS